MICLLFKNKNKKQKKKKKLLPQLAGSAQCIYVHQLNTRNYLSCKEMSLNPPPPPPPIYDVFKSCVEKKFINFSITRNVRDSLTIKTFRERNPLKCSDIYNFGENSFIICNQTRVN